MNILLTGSSGMMGTHIKKRFYKHHIIPYDIKNGQDIRKFNEDLSNIDIVIHCAAKAGVKESVKTPDLYYDINVNGTKKVFEVCEKFRTPIIFMSSSNAKKVTNPYARTKKIIEEIRPKNSICIRPHTLYPGREDMLFYNLLNNNVKYINKLHKRDFTHIDDFCDILYLIFENYNKFSGEILDIGTGISTKVIDVAKAFNWKGEKRNVPTPNEIKNTKANIDYLIKLGFTFKHNIIKDIKEYIEKQNNFRL